LLAVIAGLLVVAGLRWSFPVTMPLAAAVFIVAAVWPIKPWLDQALPSSLSYIGTILVLFLIFAGFIATIYVAVSQVAQTFAQNQEQFRQIYEPYAVWAKEKGLPILGGDGGYFQLVAIAQDLFWRVYAMLAYFGFIAILVILGLSEVPALTARFESRFGGLTAG
jgi:AI-2 transport protein TqsA